MPMMISEFPIRIAFNGADAVFEANVEQFIRPSLVDVAVEAGARITGEAPGKTSPKVEETPDFQIEAAIRHLMEEGDTSAFGADGKPRVRAIEKVMGENIRAEDRDRVWDNLNG